MKARNPFEYKIPVGQAVILGTLVGLLYFRIDNDSRGVQDVNGGSHCRESPTHPLPSRAFHSQKYDD